MASCWALRDDPKEMCKKLVEENERVRITLSHMQNIHEEVIRAREDFVIELSNELREPLQGMMAVCQMQGADALAVVMETCMHIMSTINDLMQITTASSGRLCMENVAYDPRRFLKSITKAAARDEYERQIDFCVDVDAAVPKLLTADILRLRQCLIKGCQYLLDSMAPNQRTIRLSLRVLSLDDMLLELIPRSKKYLTCLYEIMTTDERSDTSMIHRRP